MMRYLFYTCDVFTELRFGGNPLAVLPDASGLSSEQMQQIAREFNYSETSFVLPSERFTRNVRIFTPTQEVPFAGHPNIGTAFVLATLGEFGDLEHELSVTFEEKAGPVPIHICTTEKGIYCELKAPQQLSIGQTLPVALLASALSLAPDAIVTTTHPPQVASVGLPFVMVEVQDRQALKEARVHLPSLEEIHAQGVMPDIHVYTHSQDDYDLRARMFAPFDGVPEDPATGSANCALAALLSHYHSEPEGDFHWHIAQGVEMQRASSLQARTEKRAGVVTGVWIGGHSVMMSEGSITVL